MDKPIQVGDLVMLVRWPHEHYPLIPQDVQLGGVYTVTKIDSPAWCSRCREEFGAGGMMDNGYGAPLAWLKRIPPLPELESEKRDEEITA